MQPLIKINELDELQIAFSENVIDPLITIITEKEFINRAQEIQVPANKWIGKMKHEIVDVLSNQNVQERIKNGLTALMYELYCHSTKNDVSCLLKQWKKGIKNVKKQIATYEASTKPSIILEESLRFLSLQDLMKFSDKYLSEFYACGRTYYLHKEYQNAADVFFIVTLFDFFRHNSWIALGLCEEKLGNWENALHAFAIGSLTKEDAPIPYIHSAECYIALNQFEDARKSLECAREAIKLHPSEADNKLTECIIDLEKRLS